MKQDYSYGAVVFRHCQSGCEYLLVHHATGGHWDFPKGHPLLDEPPVETARREVLEETGYLIDILGHFEEAIEFTTTGGVQKRVSFFLAKSRHEAASYQPNPSEIECSSWFPYKQAKALLTYDNSKAVLEKAERFIQGWQGS